MNSHISAPHLPPLNALRAFAAAAKHASFTLAAAELGVTHGAISRQIKLLEDHLGVPLFFRAVRQVSLTPAGRELFAGVTPAFERIAATVAAVNRSAPVLSLRINVRASFAARWLIPRLPGFIREHPQIAPQIITSVEEPARLSRDSYDVIVRRGVAGWPSDFRPCAFLRDSAYAVASPSLLKRQSVRSVENLRQHVFLHSATRDDDWRGWLAVAGAEQITPAGEMHFDHLDFALRAAADGLGIAVGPATLVEQDIEAGRLHRVLPQISRPLEDYRVAISGLSNGAANIFMDWIIKQGERSPASPPEVDADAS